ncbi:MAG: hypothetical protein JNK05_03295 [Myxococcales bacterium]|nr:hypothetical protein [Myxococcales bacterium]
MSRAHTNTAARALVASLSIAVVACAPPLQTVREDRTDLPVPSLTPEQLTRFRRGDELFERPFRASQGLGPVYVRSACASCHEGDGRGPGAVERMVVLTPEGAIARDQHTLLPYGSVARPEFVAPATRGVLAPDDPSVFRSLRVGPAVFGRGYIEAVDERELERVAREQSQRAGPVRGRVPRLGDGRVGRFGVKARIATLREFVADALRGDMGLTSSVFATEVTNPEGITDDQRVGIDVDDEQLDALALYVAAIDLPRREAPSPIGASLFERARCADCHTPSLATRTDYPLAALAGRAANLYTDLLLHDMGDALADHVAEGAAGGRDWRTAPLIGLRFHRSLMHDGHARTVAEAISAHEGARSEANESVAAYRALSADEQRSLERFVLGL